MLEALRQSQIFAKTMIFLYQLARGSVWTYENIVRPVARPFWRIAVWFYWRYRCLWDKVVYTQQGYFSKTRAGVLVTSTVVAFYILPHILGFMWSLGLFSLTVDRETIYLTQSQEIYPDDDIHSVKGCEALPCSDRNAVYYRIQPSWFNQAWSMMWHGGLFYPDYVAAAVPPGVSKCEVLSYGFRAKFLMRRYDIYPDMLEVSCQMIN